MSNSAKTAPDGQKDQNPEAGDQNQTGNSENPNPNPHNN